MYKIGVLKNSHASSLSKFETEAVAPLKESKGARHLRSQTATQRIKHSTRVPSGTVPDFEGAVRDELEKKFKDQSVAATDNP